MNVHVFGGASLPSCSNHALQKTATDNGMKVAENLRKNLYMNAMCQLKTL